MLWAVVFHGKYLDDRWFSWFDWQRNGYLVQEVLEEKLRLERIVAADLLREHGLNLAEEFLLKDAEYSDFAPIESGDSVCVLKVADPLFINHQPLITNAEAEQLPPERRKWPN